MAIASRASVAASSSIRPASNRRQIASFAALSRSAAGGWIERGMQVACPKRRGLQPQDLPAVADRPGCSLTVARANRQSAAKGWISGFGGDHAVSVCHAPAPTTASASMWFSYIVAPWCSATSWPLGANHWPAEQEPRGGVTMKVNEGGDDVPEQHSQCWATIRSGLGAGLREPIAYLLHSTG